MRDKISFRKVVPSDKDTIFSWLDKPYVKEFWDNSPEHRHDILIFMKGRQEKSSYFNGIFTYWIGSLDKDPFCFLMTNEIVMDQDLPKAWQDNLSKTGKTYGIDFCIGNEKYLGQGLAAPTLKQFMIYLQKDIDPSIDKFFIDPSLNNPRAIRVYEKAGFEKVEEFVQEGGFFDQDKGILMICNLGQ